MQYNQVYLDTRDEQGYKALVELSDLDLIISGMLCLTYDKRSIPKELMINLQNTGLSINNALELSEKGVFISDGQSSIEDVKGIFTTSNGEYTLFNISKNSTSNQMIEFENYDGANYLGTLCIEVDLDNYDSPQLIITKQDYDSESSMMKIIYKKLIPLPFSTKARDEWLVNNASILMSYIESSESNTSFVKLHTSANNPHAFTEKSVARTSSILSGMNKKELTTNDKLIHTVSKRVLIDHFNLGSFELPEVVSDNEYNHISINGVNL